MEASTTSNLNVDHVETLWKAFVEGNSNNDDEASIGAEQCCKMFMCNISMLDKFKKKAITHQVSERSEAS